MEEGEDRRGMGEGEEGKRWKSESEKVNVVNGELGESAEFTNVIFQRTEMRRILNII